MSSYDITSMRTIIDIPDEILNALDRIREDADCSHAALIREALAEYTARRSTARMDTAFGLWKGRKESGTAYQKKLRSEWDKR